MADNQQDSHVSIKFPRATLEAFLGELEYVTSDDVLCGPSSMLAVAHRVIKKSIELAVGHTDIPVTCKRSSWDFLIDFCLAHFPAGVAPIRAGLGITSRTKATDPAVSQTVSRIQAEYKTLGFSSLGEYLASPARDRRSSNA